MPRLAKWGALAGTLGLVGYRMWRIEPLQLDVTPDPVSTYDEALTRFAQLRDRDSQRVNPACRTRLLTHGHRTPRAVVIFHGLSNCPQQFAALADQLHVAGYNVLLSRLPRHGMERQADDLAGLTTEEMIASATVAVDIVRGLGDDVTVMGLSAGGALAVWCAQNRNDVDRIVAISPALGLVPAPTWAERLYVNAFKLLPNVFVWWDPKLKDASPGPPDAYPRIATRAIGALMRLGKLVRSQAQHVRPTVVRALFVLNPSDDVVRNAAAREVAARWRQHGVDVDVFEFPVAWNLPHDLVDPGQVDQQVDIVYPVLAALMLNDGI